MITDNKICLKSQRHKAVLNLEIKFGEDNFSGSQACVSKYSQGMAPKTVFPKTPKPQAERPFSLKYDVVDQEVAVMNTVTSDQCSEVDLNQLSSHRQSESIKSQRDGKCSIQPPLAVSELNSDRGTSPQNRDYLEGRGVHSNTDKGRSRKVDIILPGNSVKEIDCLSSPLLKHTTSEDAQKSTPMILMLKQHAHSKNSLNPSGPQLAMQMMKQQRQKVSQANMPVESTIMVESLQVSHQVSYLHNNASRTDLEIASNSSTVKGSELPVIKKGVAMTTRHQQLQPQLLHQNSSSQLGKMLLHRSDSRQNYLVAKHTDLSIQHMPSGDKTLTLCASPTPPQKPESQNILSPNSAAKMVTSSATKTESNCTENVLKVPENGNEFLGPPATATKLTVDVNKYATVSLEAVIHKPSSPSRFTNSTKPSKKPATEKRKNSPSQLVKAPEPVLNGARTTTNQNIVKKGLASKYPGSNKQKNRKTSFKIGKDAKRSARVDIEKPLFRPYVPPGIPTTQGKDRRLTLNPQYMSTTLRKTSKNRTKMRHSLDQSWFNERNSARMSNSHASIHENSTKSPDKQPSNNTNHHCRLSLPEQLHQNAAAFEAITRVQSQQVNNVERPTVSPLLIAEELEIKWRVTPKPQHEKNLQKFPDTTSRPSIRNPSSPRACSIVKGLGQEKSQQKTRVRSITDLNLNSKAVVHNKPNVSKAPKTRMSSKEPFENPNDIKLVQTVRILSPISKTMRRSNQHHGLFTLSLIEKQDTQSKFASSLVANESILEARTPKAVRRPFSSLLKVISVKEIVCHFSFREVSQLMQLCRKTRYSQTYRKAQKSTYLDLLKKGQIDVEKVDSNRCRMWFQRLNIEITSQKNMKEHYKVDQSQRISPTKGLNGCDFEIIEADLRRSDFTMPVLGNQDKVPEETSVEDKVSQILQRLSGCLPCGYLQGMNYIVISIFRVTQSAEMTYELVVRLFRDDRLTRTFLDQTGKSMIDECQKLKDYITAYFPRLSEAMDKTGVETDYFAQTWFITLLFHFSNESSLHGRRRKHLNINSKRIMESMILDFLCLDGPKSLIKVILCAVQTLETSPNCLDQILFGIKTLQTPASQKELKQKRKQKLQIHAQNSMSSMHSESTVTLADETDDESVRLIQLIKKTASDYLSGHSQLRSITFKKDSGFFSLFQNQPSLEQKEQFYLIKEFVERYKSYHVSDRLYAKLKTQKQQRHSEQGGSKLSTNDNQQSSTSRNAPASIVRADYFTGIKQGALSTFDIGCNFLGFSSASNRGTLNEEVKRDDHHLSFTQTSSSSGDFHLTVSKVNEKDVAKTPSKAPEAPLKTTATTNGNTVTNLQASRPPMLSLKKVLRSHRTRANNLEPYSKGSNQSGQLTRKADKMHRKIQSIEKQIQVTGDDESFELQSAVTKSIRESIPESAAKNFAHSSNLGPKEPTTISPVLRFEDSQSEDNSPKMSDSSKPEEDVDLPQTEDLNETYEKTVFDNQIRTCAVKGSGITPLSPQTTQKPSKRFGSNQSTPGSTLGSNKLRAKPQCSFQKVPQQHSGSGRNQETTSVQTQVIHNSPSGIYSQPSLKLLRDTSRASSAFEISQIEKTSSLNLGFKTSVYEPAQVATSDHISESPEKSLSLLKSNKRLRMSLDNQQQTEGQGQPLPQHQMLVSKSIPNFHGGLAQLLKKSPHENESETKKLKAAKGGAAVTTLGELIAYSAKMERKQQPQRMFIKRDIAKDGNKTKKRQTSGTKVGLANTQKLRDMQTPSISRQQQQPITHEKKGVYKTMSKHKKMPTSATTGRETSLEPSFNSIDPQNSASNSNLAIYQQQQQTKLHDKAKSQYSSQIAKAARKAILSQFGLKKLPDSSNAMGAGLKPTSGTTTGSSKFLGRQQKISKFSPKQAQQMGTATLLKSWHELNNH